MNGKLRHLSTLPTLWRLIVAASLVALAPHAALAQDAAAAPEAQPSTAPGEAAPGAAAVAVPGAVPGAGGENPDGELGEGGPKIMGYEYSFRLSYATLASKYSDQEANPLAARNQSVGGIKLAGKRVVLEKYPIVRENFPHSDYGYAVLDYREETPASDFWLKRQSVTALMGYILPHHRLIAPVIGMTAEFNKISVDKADSPEVEKSDMRALVVGVDVRQKIWGTGTAFGTFYGLKLHYLTAMSQGSGYEVEASLGTAVQLSFLRLDVTAGYMLQQYNGMQPEPIGTGTLTVKSRNQSTVAMVSLWI